MAKFVVGEITLDDESAYKVSGYGGIAWYVWGEETVADPDTEWSGYEIPTGKVIATMVGDDRRHFLEPEDLEPISEDDYCGECGQIGCQWG